MIHNLDRHKAGMIAAGVLEQRPDLAAVLSRREGADTAWRIRCDVLAGDRVIISARDLRSGATIALAEVSRAEVTLDPERPAA